MVWSRQGNRGQGIHAILNPSSSSLENRERCAGWRVPNSQRGIATPCDAHVRMRGAGVQGHVKSLERSVCVCMWVEVTGVTEMGARVAEVRVVAAVARGARPNVPLALPPPL